MPHERMSPIEADKKAVESLPDETLTALINEAAAGLAREKRQLAAWQEQLGVERPSGWDIEGGVTHALGSVAKIGYNYETLLTERQRRANLKKALK